MGQKHIAVGSAGFTLVELGIVIGVIAVMASVIFTARGFIDNSRVGSSLQLVSAVREAARGFALRQCGGSSFNCDTTAGGPNHLDSINKLVGPNNFFVNVPEDPWENGPIVVAAAAGAPDWIDITLCLGDGDNSDELATDFSNAAESMGTVSPPTPCGSGTEVTLRTR